MRISLPAEQLKILYDSLENLTDAVLRGKGLVSDEKLAAIFEYVGLKKNKETIKQAKIFIDEFEEIINDPEMDKKRAVTKITRIGIPPNYAESAIDILFGNKSQMQSTQQNVRSKMECPACNNNELEIQIKGKLCCSRCGATFLKEGSKYKLLDINDKKTLFWIRGSNLTLNYKDWLKLKTCGYHVHFDIKANAYVPYIPDEYSESKPSIPPQPMLLTSSTSKMTAENISSEAKRIKKSTVTETRDQKRMAPEELHAHDEVNKHYVTNAGEFLLDATIDDVSKARNLLRRFNKGNSLNNKELDFLLKHDLLDENQW
jgi:ribosomal protein L37AE/L43A